jgi:catechol 2,3-dioxygenase-like lactoylglutathione lyase family enzyme
MRIAAIHHVKFAVRDLDRQEAFARDFGLETAERTSDRLAMRTCGGDSFAYVAERGDRDRFVGLAFEVDDEASLEEAVARLGAKEAAPLDLPGGGCSVALTDPDGNEVLLVKGNARRHPDEAYPELVHNTPFRKERFGRNQHPRAIGPARLWRLGHLGLFVKSFRASAAWYAENLGLVGSDIYHVPGQPHAQIVGFFRLDRGEEYVDHHVVALMQDERGGCHHISFEVQDYEAQKRTHRFLRRQNYESIWGVGRHPHGSHVFDVWRSPDGARFETFSDTDLFRLSDGTNLHDISTVVMDEWVDDSPERYFA